MTNLKIQVYELVQGHPHIVLALFIVYQDGTR